MVSWKAEESSKAKEQVENRGASRSGSSDIGDRRNKWGPFRSGHDEYSFTQNSPGGGLWPCQKSNISSKRWGGLFSSGTAQLPLAGPCRLAHSIIQDIGLGGG